MYKGGPQLALQLLKMYAVFLKTIFWGKGADREIYLYCDIVPSLLWQLSINIANPDVIYAADSNKFTA